jgi:hypothetical protein
MRIVEPTARPTAGAVVPEQADHNAAGAADHVDAPSGSAPAVVIDHVRAHAVACYWDHLECRWCCSR